MPCFLSSNDKRINDINYLVGSQGVAENTSPVAQLNSALQLEAQRLSATAQAT